MDRGSLRNILETNELVQSLKERAEWLQGLIDKKSCPACNTICDSPTRKEIMDASRKIFDEVGYLLKFISMESMTEDTGSEITLEKGEIFQFSERIDTLDELLESVKNDTNFEFDFGDLEAFLSNFCNDLKTLNKFFDDKIYGQSVFFIGEEQEQWLKYQDPKEFRKDFDEIGNRLPRNAKNLLIMAGDSIAYGLPVAAISLALQAVESTLRFFCFRLGKGEKENKREWGPLLNEVSNMLPDPWRKTKGTLDGLRDDHRNVLLHGRMYKNSSHEEAIKLTQECWNMVKNLATDRKTALTIKIIISPNFDLHSAIAAYFFYINEELPKIKKDNFGFFPGHEGITDMHFKRDFPGGTKSICNEVMDHLKMSQQTKRPYRSLLDYTENLTKNGPSHNFKNSGFKRQYIELDNIFELIRIEYKFRKDPWFQLKYCFDIFEKMVQEKVLPDEPWLLQRLDLDEMYNNHEKDLIHLIKSSGSP